MPTASSGRSGIRRRESDQSRVVSAELIGGIGSFRNATLAASGSHFPGMLSARLKLTPSLRPTDLVDNMDVEDHATERARGAMEPAVHQQQHPQKRKQALEPERFRKGPELAHLRRVQEDLDQSGPTVVGVGHHAGCRGDSDPTRSHH